jgi:hypothetical protein
VVTQTAANPAANRIILSGADDRDRIVSCVSQNPTTGLQDSSSCTGVPPLSRTGETSETPPDDPGGTDLVTDYFDRTAGRFAWKLSGDENHIAVSRADVRWVAAITISGALATGDSQGCTIVPPAFTGFTGWQLISVTGRLLGADTTGITAQVAKHEGATPANMLSTAFTTDAGEILGSDATAPAVIDALEDDVLPEDLVCLDLDAIDDGVGLSMALEFQPL